MRSRWIPLLVAASLAGGCALFSSGPQVQVLELTAYDPSVTTPDPIRRDCRVHALLVRLIDHEADDLVLRLREPPASGRYLDMRITEFVATPPEGFPGRVWMAVEGELLDGDAVIGSFRTKRRSRVDADNQVGACAQLREISAKMADDIAGWLKRPSMNARFGGR